MLTTLKIFNCRLYVQEFILLLLCYLFLESMFSWLFLRNSVVIELYTKSIGIFAYGFLLYKYNALTKGERVYLIIFSLIMVRLLFESLFKYDTVFRQLTMFTVLAPVVYTLFVKYILRTLQLDLMEFVARFYFYAYILFMLFFGKGFSFSLDAVEMDDYGPFSGDGRLLHASHILMMVIPFLWYLDRFLNTRKNKYLIPFLLCFVIIVIHQHRSVWSSCGLALAFYLFAAIRNRQLRLGVLGQTLVGAALLLGVSFFFVTNLFPGFTDFLSERFSEIMNPAKEGSTGNFRIQQRDVYSALAMERPVFGWTFEGFEMENPLVDWWPANTGQHFHEGYIEMLFYHGIVGLVLKYSFLLYLLVKVFSKKLSAPAIILSAFCVSGLLFSFNYVLPLVFWGHVGLCLYYVERKEPAEAEEEEAVTEEEEAFAPYTIIEQR